MGLTQAHPNKYNYNSTITQQIVLSTYLLMDKIPLGQYHTNHSDYKSIGRYILLAKHLAAVHDMTKKFSAMFHAWHNMAYTLLTYLLQL